MSPALIALAAARAGRSTAHHRIPLRKVRTRVIETALPTAQVRETLRATVGGLGWTVADHGDRLVATQGRRGATTAR